jgi:hypothetical protein
MAVPPVCDHLSASTAILASRDTSMTYFDPPLTGGLRRRPAWVMVGFRGKSPCIRALLVLVSVF